MSEEVKTSQTAEQAVVGLIDKITSTVGEKTKKPMSHRLKKHVGQTEGLKSDKKKGETANLFLSIRKSLTLFMNDQEMIIFKGRTFTTDKADVASFIRKHPAFGTEIFEDKYPEHVTKAMTENDKYITHDRKEYDSGSSYT